MRLVKDGIEMVTENENVICAFLEAGFVEEAKEEKPKPPRQKKAKEEK